MFMVNRKSRDLDVIGKYLDRVYVRDFCPEHVLSVLSTGRKDIFYTTTYSTHFIYAYMASDLFTERNWYKNG